MALINCKNCGKEVSDKAKVCPSCGVVLIEDVTDENNSVFANVTRCEECGQELPDGAEICPNCGCPVESKEVPQYITEIVDNPKEPAKKSNKKGIVIGVISSVLVVICIVIGLIVKSNNDKKTVQNYASNLSSTTFTMLTGAAEAESAGNLIKNVWHDCIYKEFDIETSEYVKDDKNKYFEDFNDALRKLFADDSFQRKISTIEDNQESVKEQMRQLQNPPKEYEEAYGAIKDYYQAYLNFTGLVISPSGSLSTFSSNFNDADSETIRLYNSMKLYIEE